MKVVLRRLFVSAGLLAVMVNAISADFSVNGGLYFRGVSEQKDSVQLNNSDLYGQYMGVLNFDAHGELDSGWFVHSNLSLRTGTRTQRYVDFGNQQETSFNDALDTAYVSLSGSEILSITVGRHYDSSDRLISCVPLDGISTKISLGSFSITPAYFVLESNDPTNQQSKGASMASVMMQHSGLVDGLVIKGGAYQVKDADRVTWGTHQKGNTANQFKTIFADVKYYAGDRLSLTAGYLKNMEKAEGETDGHRILANYVGSDYLSISFEYRKLGANALFDNLTDSDFKYGEYGTGIKGWIVGADYTEGGMSLGVKAYITELDNATINEPEGNKDITVLSSISFSV
jgi:hypothetical protein